MQVLDGENVPELLLVNETVPVGAVGDDVVSVTVAAHWAAWLTAADPGSQATIVLVV